MEYIERSHYFKILTKHLNNTCIYNIKELAKLPLAVLYHDVSFDQITVRLVAIDSKRLPNQCYYTMVIRLAKVVPILLFI